MAVEQTGQVTRSPGPSKQGLDTESTYILAEIQGPVPLSHWRGWGRAMLISQVSHLEADLVDECVD